MPSSPNPRSFIWDIVEINPRQLAPIMGTLGVGTMDSATFSPSSKSNLKIKGNNITFVTVDFQPHSPTLAPVFASLD
jgi:hypothetical protein